LNLATFERAQVAAFAYREARLTGSLDCMKAVCYVLRNRVKAGWADSSWLGVLENAPQVMGNLAVVNDGGPALVSHDRLLQLLVRDIDDIYLAQDWGDDPVRRVVCGDEPKDARAALYYSFVDRQPRPWFVENIVQKPVDHPQLGNVGPIMLFR
jgi:hypothetical protein